MRRYLLLGSATTVPLMVLAQPASVAAATPAFISVCTGLGVTTPVIPAVTQAVNNVTSQVIPGLAPVTTGVLGGVANPVVNGVLGGVGGVVNPLVNGVLGGVGGVVNPVVNGVVGNGSTVLSNTLNGTPLSVGVINPATNSLLAVPSAACNVAGNSFAVDANTGVSLGGGIIAGLGGMGNVPASAGDVTAVAVGNGALTAAGVPNAIALGAGATTNVANSVALGANALAVRGALTNYTALGLSAPQTSTGEVSVGAVGATRQITNLAAGSDPTDAVNVDQLRGAIEPLSVIGSTTAAALGVTFNPTTGQISTPNFTVQGANYSNVTAAFGAVDAALTQAMGKGGVFASNNAAGAAVPAAGGANASAGGYGAVATGIGSTAIGNGASAQGNNSVALGAGSTDGGQDNVVSVGAAGAERRITNVAAGTISATSTDAVNGSQLASLGHSSLQYDTDATGRTLASVSLSSDQGGPVTIHNLAPGVANSDAATVGQVKAEGENTVHYATQNGVKTNLIALSGGSPGGVTIRNVADGVQASDAVNLSQLQSYAGSSNAYTDQQVSNLAAYTQKEISQARSDAAGGTALALAATGLRYVDTPGKYSVAGATAYYHDQMGLAFGVGHTSEDGRWRLNAAVTASPTMTNPDVGVVAGVSVAIN